MAWKIEMEIEGFEKLRMSVRKLYSTVQQMERSRAGEEVRRCVCELSTIGKQNVMYVWHLRYVPTYLPTRRYRWHVAG